MADDWIVALPAEHVTSGAIVVAVTLDPEAEAEVGVNGRRAVVLPERRWNEAASLHGACYQLTPVCREKTNNNNNKTYISALPSVVTVSHRKGIQSMRQSQRELANSLSHRRRIQSML